jgi:hypothetical protein
MSVLRQAAQMALEVLENERYVYTHIVDAITTLREALEREHALHDLARLGQEIEQEPVKLHEPVISAWSLREVYFDADGEPSMHRSPPAAQPEPPPEWEAINNILNEYGLQAIDFVAEWKATLWQAEPVAWGVFEGNLHDMFFTEEEAQEMADLKGTHAEVRPLYTSPAAQRPWVGLTDEDWAKVEDMPDTFDQGAAWAQARLKEKNT